MDYKYFREDTNFYKILSEILAIEDEDEQALAPQRYDTALYVLRPDSPHFSAVAAEIVHVLQSDITVADKDKMIAAFATFVVESNLNYDPKFPDGDWRDQPAGILAVKSAIDDAVIFCYNNTKSEALHSFLTDYIQPTKLAAPLDLFISATKLIPTLPEMINGINNSVPFGRKPEP